MSHRIYITRAIPEIAISILKDKGFEVDSFLGEGIPTHDDLCRALRQKPYDAVISLLTDRIDAEVFDACPTAKLYSTYAMGYDNIDLVAAQERGILIANTPGDYSRSIAEHTLALLFSLASRIVEADAFVRAGKYQGWEPMHFLGTDVKGLALGLVGTGRIGTQVAQLAKAVGMQVMYHDIARATALEESIGAVYFAHLEELLERADVVSLHVPLLSSTRHLINAERLALMKKSAFLLNTSRGAVVDEVALVAALQAGSIAGAGLDVFEFEPSLSRGLAQLSNVVLTPHIASARLRARQEMARIVAGNVIEFFEIGRVTNTVGL